LASFSSCKGEKGISEEDRRKKKRKEKKRKEGDEYPHHSTWTLENVRLDPLLCLKSLSQDLLEAEVELATTEITVESDS